MWQLMSFIEWVTCLLAATMVKYMCKIHFWFISPYHCIAWNLQKYMTTHIRLCGLMDKASGIGPEDCRFESCHNHITFFCIISIYEIAGLAQNYRKKSCPSEAAIKSVKYIIYCTTSGTDRLFSLGAKRNRFPYLKIMLSKIWGQLHFW